MEKRPRQYVFESMELLPHPLIPFVEKRLKIGLGEHWRDKAVRRIKGLRANSRGKLTWDQSNLLYAMDIYWGDAFHPVLERAVRALVNELITVRNKLSHNEPFTGEDAARALDSMYRLLVATGAEVEAEHLGKMRDEILRRKFATPGPDRERLTAPRSKTPVQKDPKRTPGFTQEAFNEELRRMLEMAHKAGKTSCRVISRDLHRGVIGESRANRMPMACNAMWKLWEEQGSVPGRIIHTTPKGRSSTIEIEYQLT